MLKKLNHPVIQSFKVVLTGNILTQIIGLLSYTILARQYSTEVFGAAGLFVSMAMVCSIIHTGQIFWDLYRNQDDHSQKRCHEDSINFSLKVTPYLFLIALIVAFVFPTKLGYLILLIPFFSLSYSLLEIHKVFLNSRGEYKKSVAKVFSARFFGQFLKIILFYISQGPISLVLGEMTGNFLTIIKLVKTFKWKNSLIEIFDRNKSTISYYVPINFFNLCIQEMPIILASFMYSFSESGAYFLLNKLIIFPMTLVGNSFGNSQIKKLNSFAKRPKEKVLFLLKSYAVLLFVGTIPAVIIFVWGTELTQILLGNGHSEVADLSRIVAFILPFRLIKALGIISGVNSGLHKLTFVFRGTQFILICLLAVGFKDFGFERMIVTLLCLDSLVDIILATLAIIKTYKRASLEKA